MRTILLTIVLFATTTFHSMAVSRQESKNELKKVVYSGNCANCPHYVTGGGGSETYWAVVSVPELTVENMSSVTLYIYESGAPAGWKPINLNQRMIMQEGTCYILWKYDYGGGQVSVRCAQFKIVIIYESGTELGVQNAGTGKALDLEWHTDDTTAKKIRGYKVKRREKQ